MCFRGHNPTHNTNQSGQCCGGPAALCLVAAGPGSEGLGGEGAPPAQQLSLHPLAPWGPGPPACNNGPSPMNTGQHLAPRDTGTLNRTSSHTSPYPRKPPPRFPRKSPMGLMHFHWDSGRSAYQWRLLAGTAACSRGWGGAFPPTGCSWWTEMWPWAPPSLPPAAGG